MNPKKLFFILATLFTASVVLWYVFLYRPNSQRIQVLDSQLKQTFAQLKSANHAKVDMKNIELRLEKEKKNLENLKKRFVDKNNLTEVTITMKHFASRYGLELVDFAPVLENYFSQNPKSRVLPLPLAITIKGDYIQMGRFIEDWQKLPFFIIPEEIVVEKPDENKNDLQAVVTGKLYCWNN